MILTSLKLPDITQDMLLSVNLPLNNDLTIVIIFKSLNRSDNVIIDLYRNDISEETKIITGKILQPDSVIKNPDSNFNYKIECVDEDGIHEPITQNNLHKFYIQFVQATNEELSFETATAELGE